ncbi:hypothetical protein AKJ09_03671 [Labilithrix luteola]|uniref:Uncharacterized protein n=1 Tax=Labilithrix luteola TaxID=1391654 RepID=A0A0K1PU12_9BACT|nr:hypothetical protein [Labilithrix luteola]AKU97007.1 hypothetical protein AKJ09_03671 [Labilithrix luteola]
MSDEQTQAALEAIPPQMREAMESVFGSDSGAAAEETQSATPPSGATDSPAATPAAEPKDPAKERVAARILAARRADMRAAEQRKAIAEERAALEKQKVELKDIAALAEQAKGAKLSPSKLIELAGLDPKSFLESLATEHEPASVAARVAAATKSETDLLREELAAMKREREQERAQSTRAQLDAQVVQAQQGFIQHIAASAEKYPHLIEEYTPAEIAAEGLRVAEEHAEAYKKKFGTYPDEDVIAEYLEDQAKARAADRAAWHGQIGKAAPKPRQGGLTGEHQMAPSESQGRGPRTLTSDVTSTRVAPPKPWSQEFADEESIRILKAATR